MKRPTTLSAAFVRTIRRPGRYGDGRGGHGLSLLVKPTKIEGRLSKTWSQRIAINGQRVTIGLGSFPAVTLAEARRRALRNRRHVAEGRDPRTPNAPTFREATEKVIAIHRAKWTPRSKTERQWRNLFSAHVLPKIGNKGVDQITTAEVLAILSPLWHTKVETARKVKRYITAVTKWAVAQGYRTDNPADDRIRDALGRQTRNTQHMRSIHHSHVVRVLRVLDASGAWRSTVLAIRFLALTAARSGEVRLAQWEEVDLAGQVWEIPGSRTKTGKLHRVPLSGQALAVLAEAAGLTRGVGLIFPSATGRPMSDSTLSKLFRENAIGCVPHGLRSSFRDWCAETGVSQELAERALGHTVRNPVEAAYSRTDLLEARRPLMQAWSDYLT